MQVMLIYPWGEFLFIQDNMLFSVGEVTANPFDEVLQTSQLSRYHRETQSHGGTVSAVISRSHGGGLISHGLLSVSTKALPILTRQEV